MNSDFIDIYGSVGYFLRNLEINTTSRVAMLASLLHLQSADEFVKFEKIYEFSLEQTDEKLENSSFNTLRSKLNKAVGSSDLIVHVDIDGDDAFKASAELSQLVDEAASKLDSLIKQIE